MIEKFIIALVASIVLLVTSGQALLLFAAGAAFSCVARLRLSTRAVLSSGTVTALIVGAFYWVVTALQLSKRVYGDWVFSRQDYILIGSPVFSAVAGLFVLIGVATGLLLNMLYKRMFMSNSPFRNRKR